MNRKEYHKKYRLKNKDKISQYRKEYYEKNRDKAVSNQKKYYQKNKEKYREYNQEYYKKNRDRIIEQKRTWVQENKEAFSQYQKEYYQRTKKEQKLKRIQYYKEWIEILQKFQGKIQCKFCKYDKCFASIDFHHKNSNEKEFEFGNLLWKKPTPGRTELLKKELKKGYFLCSNCHRELHFQNSP